MSDLELVLGRGGGEVGLWVYGTQVLYQTLGGEGLGGQKGPKESDIFHQIILTISKIPFPSIICFYVYYSKNPFFFSIMRTI